MLWSVLGSLGHVGISLDQLRECEGCPDTQLAEILEHAQIRDQETFLHVVDIFNGETVGGSVVGLKVLTLGIFPFVPVPVTLV